MKGRYWQGVWRWSVLLVFAVWAAGCEGVGIPATDDPNAKLGQADYLLNGAGRIMQARRMTEQAIVIFEQRGDKAGLAKAYRQLGLVALSGGLGDNPVIIHDTRVPLQPRPGDIDLAEVNLKRARDLSVETGQLYLIANIDFVLGNAKVLSGKPLDACPLYDAAIGEFHDAQTRQPDVKLQTMPGYEDPAALVLRAKKEAGCQ